MSSSYNTSIKHNHADILYQVLPSVYRERDDSEDLKKYLNAAGLLLDQVHRTLLQRYADIFPDDDAAFDISSQTWILPYIAQLLDVTMLSPDEEGRREEVSNAVSWRKKKGTISVIDEIAEAIGRLEVVVHEGWKRVATTARVGMPVLPLENFGYSDVSSYEDDFLEYREYQTKDFAPMWAKHPGLPAGTVDLRCQSGAVATNEDNPAVKISHFNGEAKHWRQSSLHGAQSCKLAHSVLPVDGKTPDWVPGYFDDVSVRTVDFRTPGWRKGYYHPDNVLLYEAPHPGFFVEIDNDRKFTWKDNLINNADFLNLVEVTINGDSTIFRNKSLDSNDYKPVHISQRVELGQVSSGVGPADPLMWRFEGFHFKNTIEVDSGRLELDRCAVLSAEVHSEDTETPVLTITNSLCKRIQAATGLIRLQYCTILTTTIAEKIQASECIFNGLIRKDHNTASKPGEGCIRYSSVLPGQDRGLVKLHNTKKVEPVFFSDIFLEHGCGVLHPANHTHISNGAEDGGELGACHHLYIIARRDAVILKLHEYLPVGMKAVIIPDMSIYDIPDAEMEAEE